MRMEKRWERVKRILEIPPLHAAFPYIRGQCMAGSFAGAADSERVPESHEGRLRFVRNESESVKVEACLTARLTCRAETKVDFSDPEVPCGRAFAQRIKGTPGITG